MRLYRLTGILVLFSITLTGQVAIKKLSISPLTDSFYVFTTYQSYQGTLFPSNGMYFLTKDGAVLIDCPWDTTQFQPLLDSIQYKHRVEVVLSIATHSHKDRTSALDFLKNKGIKTYTSLMTDLRSKSTNERRAEYVFIHDTFFQVGERRFQTFYGGAGHTPDNIVIWFENKKILYGGCLIKSTEAKDLGNLADADVRNWPRTIKRIQRKFKNPRYVIPGHQGWTDTRALNHTLVLLSTSQTKQ